MRLSAGQHDRWGNFDNSRILKLRRGRRRFAYVRDHAPSASQCTQATTRHLQPLRFYNQQRPQRPVRPAVVARHAGASMFILKKATSVPVWQ